MVFTGNSTHRKHTHCITNTKYLVYFQVTINKMQRFSIFFISTDALHVSDGSSAHHQEHKNGTYSFRYCQTALLLAAIVDEMVPSHPR
jgi:hypothetical protein